MSLVNCPLSLGIMITLHDIETAVVERLNGAGHTVTAAEVDEGFVKPAFFIDIFQNSVTMINQFMELVNIAVELRYFPDIETREAQIIMADKLRILLTATPIKVADRFLTVHEITFETDKTALLCYFELEFIRETSITQEDSEIMEIMEWEGLDYGNA